MNAPPLVKLLELASSFQSAQVVLTANELGIFNTLSSYPEGLSAKEVADILSTNLDGTERLLNTCTGLQLLTKTAGPTVVYNNTPDVTKYFNRSSPDSIAPVLSRLKHSYHLFDNLSQIIKTSVTAADAELFTPGNGLYETSEQQADFILSMEIMASSDVFAIVERFSTLLSQCSTICDLGGCSGVLARRIALRVPASRVILFDLPEIINNSTIPKAFGVEIVAGDFFKDPLPLADLYVLSHIIHMWSDDNRVHQLFDRVMKSLPSGGYILILEKLLDDEKTGPKHVLTFDIAMMLTCGGRERSAAEISELLKSHGFIKIQTHLIPTSTRSAVLAMKP